MFLSYREFECMALTANNKTIKEIGKLLYLSPRTVEQYLFNVRSKLGCNSKREIIQIAHNNPLIEIFTDFLTDPTK